MTMETYSSSNSSSKSSYLSQNTEAKGVKQVYPFKFHSLLHSVRKSPGKKAPIAPMPPKPVKVYKVDVINFKDLVQQLTCAPEFIPPHSHQQQFLQRAEGAAAATSIGIDDDAPSRPLQNLLSRDTEDFGMSSLEGATGLLEMNLFSPTSYGNWCFFPPTKSPRM